MINCHRVHVSDANADLLTIRNSEENDFVKEQLIPFQNLAQFVWLGMYKDNNGQYFTWHTEFWIL